MDLLCGQKDCLHVLSRDRFPACDLDFAVGFSEGIPGQISPFYRILLVDFFVEMFLCDFPFYHTLVVVIQYRVASKYHHPFFPEGGHEQK